MNKKLYPLKFQPVVKYRVWGGSKLVDNFNKQLPTDEEIDAAHIGESWELYDQADGSSMITNGWLADNTIADVVETYLGDILGDNILDNFGTQVPLLIKMLDIDERLSVQVHPSDEIALERYDSLGKTEFWYVMEADPNAVVYMGFKRDITPQEFFEACKNQTAKDLMNEYHPKKGDCFLVKAGTVHAACGGIVIAEIQEQSDLTFRLYDWGREHNPATARKMHLEEAIDCIDYNKYKESECLMREVKENVMVADCKQFTINNIALKDTYHVYPENYNSFIIYICTEGAAMIQAGDQTYDLVKGEMIMIPSSMEDFYISPKDINTNLLESYIKEIREPEDSYVEDAQ